MNTAYCIVLTTASTEAESEAIAHALIESQLAACISFHPVNSVYTWQGQVQREAEWQLVIKTKRACFDLLAAKLQDIHSYDTPEIIALPIEQGSADYLNWLEAQVNQPD